jgi:hypothetical protein
MTKNARHSSGSDPISRLLGDREPLEVARELFVYAPIGIASRLGKDLPDLIAEGRNKYSVAKVMGTFAAQQGRRQFEERVRSATQHLWSEPSSTPNTAEATDSTPPVDDQPITVEPDVETPTPSSQTGAVADDLPIARYDTLSASQVLSHLTSLTPVQRAAVAEFERNNRNRRTILNRIAHLDDAQS